MDIQALLAAGESETVEFKPALRAKDPKNKRYVLDVNTGILKSVAGFMNAKHLKGGTLIVGVDNEGNPNGEALGGFTSEDKATTHLMKLLIDHLGVEAAGNVRCCFPTVNGIKILTVRCPFDVDVFPVYVAQGQSPSGRKMFIRLANGTYEIGGQETHDHVESVRKRHAGENRRPESAVADRRRHTTRDWAWG